MDRHLLVCLLLLGLTPCSTLSAQQPRQPFNVLLIMVDDLGKEWIGCYGADDIETPHIDALAASGTKFTNFYCMPQCTPSRVTLLTGQYPFRHGWVNHWDVPRWGGGCSFDPDLNPSFARVMRDAGWKTAAAGKWQIDDFRQEPDAMVQAGFDDYCMWTGYETENPPSGKRYYDPYIYSNGSSKTHTGRFGPDVFTDFLVDFMADNKDQPWLMYFPMALTHGPLVATPDDPEAASKLDKHKAMVRYTDKLVGKLVSTLEQHGLREQTIIIFTTDNGTSRGIIGRIEGREIRGGKALTTENGICVPFIVSCPGSVPSGVVSDALADMTDIGPTLLNLAGVAANQAMDGVSFKSVLLGESATSSRQWIMAMGGGNNAKLTDAGVENQFWFRDRVLRNERYKIYIGPDRQPEKLVDLENDPAEEVNLLDSGDAAAMAARDLFLEAVAKMPARDEDPRYTPLQYRDWYRKPDTPSQVWKKGYPGQGSDR